MQITPSLAQIREIAHRVFNGAHRLSGRALRAAYRAIGRHCRLAETLTLAAILAILLAFVPWVGHLLAIVVLVAGALLGVARELRSEILQAGKGE